MNRTTRSLLSMLWAASTRGAESAVLAVAGTRLARGNPAEMVEAVEAYQRALTAGGAMRRARACTVHH